MPGLRPGAWAAASPRCVIRAFGAVRDPRLSARCWPSARWWAAPPARCVGRGFAAVRDPRLRRGARPLRGAKHIALLPKPQLHPEVSRIHQNRCWHEGCTTHSIVAKDFTGLEAWRSADRLRRFILDQTRNGPAARDFKFKDQIRDAADGTTRNLAEGFGRYRHKDFARFVIYAIGSADEVKDQIRSAKLRGLFSDEICDTALKRTRRARSDMLRLLRHLQSTDPPNSS